MDSIFAMTARTIGNQLNHVPTKAGLDASVTVGFGVFLAKYESWQYEKEWRVVDFENQHLDVDSRRLACRNDLLPNKVSRSKKRQYRLIQADPFNFYEHLGSTSE